MYYDEMQCLSGLIAFCVGSFSAFSALFYSKMYVLGNRRSSVGGLFYSLSADCRLRGAVLYN